MDYDNEHHVKIGNISNRDNKFITTVEPSLNNYFNELIDLSKSFETIIVI